MTLQAPPPYSADQAPPTAPANQTNEKQGPGAPAPRSTTTVAPVYWIYWIVSFATLLTWALSVAAAVDDAWLESELGITWQLGEECNRIDACDLIDAATVCQFLATAIISIALLVISISAFMPAPWTGRLGIAVAVLLAIFSVLQLTAFCLVKEFSEEIYLSQSSTSYGYRIYTSADVSTGPTLAVAAVAFCLGVVGTILILALRSRATNGHGGPFNKCCTPGHGGVVVETGPQHVQVAVPAQPLAQQQGVQHPAIAHGEHQYPAQTMPPPYGAMVNNAV